MMMKRGTRPIGAQKLCESRGGRPGLPSPSLIIRTVSVDVKPRLKNNKKKKM